MKWNAVIIKIAEETEYTSLYNEFGPKANIMWGHYQPEAQIFLARTKDRMQTKQLLQCSFHCHKDTNHVYLHHNLETW